MVEFATGSCMAAFGVVEGFEYAAAIDSNLVSGEVGPAFAVQVAL